VRRDDADRSPVVGGEVVAVVAVREQDAGLGTLRQRQVRRVAVERVKQHVFGRFVDARALGDRRERDAGELAAELAPSRHAVEVLPLGDGR